MASKKGATGKQNQNYIHLLTTGGARSSAWTSETIIRSSGSSTDASHAGVLSSSATTAAAGAASPGAVRERTKSAVGWERSASSMSNDRPADLADEAERDGRKGGKR